MFGDIGMTELILIGVVALIVIGPKDLPEMFRTLGRFTAKLRSMSREFSRAMEQAAKETGVNDVAKDIRSATSPGSLGLNAVKDAATKFEQWDPLKSVRAPAKSPLPVNVPPGNMAVAAPAVAAVAAPEPEMEPEPEIAEETPVTPAKKPRAPRKKAAAE